MTEPLDGIRDCVGKTYDYENAAHIVHCVNSHDALAEALERFLSHHAATHPGERECTCTACDVARAALEGCKE